MDLLQIGLIFLIVILAIFLSITGFQVFLILRDMKKTLDRVNGVLFNERSSEKLKSMKKSSRPTSPATPPRRFFKKGF